MEKREEVPEKSACIRKQRKLVGKLRTRTAVRGGGG